jgi:hypothetical protein
LLSLLACSPVGRGEGELEGTIEIEDCRARGRYNLDPTAFFAQAVEDVLSIRVQRGSDLEVRSDGLAVLVEDAALVNSDYLDRPIEVGPDAEPQIDLTLYLNSTCPPGRDRTPVVLGAVRGTIRFDDIYSPDVDDDEVRIHAELDNVRFEDSRIPGRWAELSGFFEFLYVRGSPAQRFP